MTDNTEALPPLPEQLAATFIGYVEGLLGVCLVPSHVFDAFEQRADEFRAALAQRQQAAPSAQAEPVAQQQSEFITMVREAVAASKAAPVGTAVPLPPSLTAEFRKFMRDEPSAFDSIAWGELKTLAGAAPPSAQAEPDDEPRFTAGGGFPGDHNGEKAAQAEPQVPLPFNSAQRRRLWDNSPEIHADAKSFAAFERIVQLVEAANGIGKQEGK